MFEDRYELVSRPLGESSEMEVGDKCFSVEGMFRKCATNGTRARLPVAAGQRRHDAQDRATLPRVREPPPASPVGGAGGGSGGAERAAGDQWVSGMITGRCRSVTLWCPVPIVTVSAYRPAGSGRDRRVTWPCPTRIVPDSNVRPCRLMS